MDKKFKFFKNGNKNKYIFSILPTKTRATQNEVALSYHRVRGLHFLEDVFVTTIGYQCCDDTSYLGSSSWQNSVYKQYLLKHNHNYKSTPDTRLRPIIFKTDLIEFQLPQRERFRQKGIGIMI